LMPSSYRSKKTRRVPLRVVFAVQFSRCKTARRLPAATNNNISHPRGNMQASISRQNRFREPDGTRQSRPRLGPNAARRRGSPRGPAAAADGAAYSPRERMCGNKSTSRIEGESVSSMTSRSTPMPSPPVGGMPYSSARRKS